MRNLQISKSKWIYYDLFLTNYLTMWYNDENGIQLIYKFRKNIKKEKYRFKKMNFYNKQRMKYVKYNYDFIKIIFIYFKFYYLNLE